MISYDIPFGLLFETSCNYDDSLLLVCLDNGECKAIRVGDLYYDMYNYFILYKNIKSMAYMNSDDYCAKIHDHDCYTSCFYNDNVGGVNSVRILLLNNMYVNCENHTPDYSLLLKAKERSRNKIGELRFFVRPNNPVNIQSPSFDGWLPADDAVSYNLSDFMLSATLSQVYPYTATLFKLPKIDNFMKFQGVDTIPTSYSMSENPGRNSCPPHTHTIASDVSESNPVTLTVRPNSQGYITILKTKLGAGTETAKTTVKHEGGDENRWSVWESGTLTLSFTNKSLGSINTSSYGASYNAANKTNTETYPTHNNIPVYIYVGPSRWTVE